MDRCDIKMMHLIN